MHITDIIIPERFRSNYDDIESLACSISQHGLFNAVILTQNGDLNQGGRRLSAMRLIYEVAQGNGEELEVTPEGIATILDNASPALLEGRLTKNTHYRIIEMEDRYVELICELEENFQRVNITWQDKAKLVDAIHTAQQEIHGKSSNSGKGWNMADTAKHLGMAPSSICTEIKIAEALKSSDPDIAGISGAKDRATALKKILERAEEVVNAEIRRRESANLAKFSSETQLTNLDALECIAGLTKGSFNHVITDPPYAIEFDKMTAGKSESTNYIEFSTSDYIPYMEKLASALWEKIHTGYFICFCAHQHYQALCDTISDAGFSVSNVPLLWIKKGDPGKNNHPDRQLTSLSEIAVVAWKNIPLLNIQGKGNIFDYRSHIDIKERFHITQKPIALLEDIVDTFTRPGEVVLDCFMGSGSTIKACISLGRGFIGNDKSDYFDEAQYSIMKHKEDHTSNSSTE